MKTTSHLLLFLSGFIFALSSSDSCAKNLANKNKILIAVIDSGIDTNHPLVKEKININIGEIGIDKNGNNKRTNGIDDDNDGFIDNVYGWNFTNNTNDLTDNIGHGTHISGMISELENIEILPLKVFDNKIKNYDASLATSNAIRYAVDHQVDLINYSGGGLTPSEEEKKAIEYAKEKNILIIAAAGNEKSNSDTHPFYPADYKLNNILSVAAVKLNGELLPSSNFGVQSVSIAAFGEKILSSIPENGFGIMTGTSQATANATKAAAMILLKINSKNISAWSQQKKYSKTRYLPETIIRNLIKTGDPVASLNNKIKHPVVINLLRASQLSN